MTMLYTLEHLKVRNNVEVGCPADPQGASCGFDFYSRILYNKQHSLTAVDEECAAPHLITSSECKVCDCLRNMSNTSAHGMQCMN